MLPQMFVRNLTARKSRKPAKKQTRFAVESLESRLALATLTGVNPTLHLGETTNYQQADASNDTAAYLRKHQSLQRILTDGQWLSTVRDINVYDPSLPGGDVTPLSKTDGNNYIFTAATPTQLTAKNSYVLSDSNPTVHQVNWVVQVNPHNDTFILRDPTTPSREATGHYDRKTDSLVLLINGPAGPGAEPNSGPAWGITTNYYTHVRGQSKPAVDAQANPILHLNQLTKYQQADATNDTAAYLKKHQALQRILANGQWLSTHRDINVYDSGKVTSIKKTDGNNYILTVASPTQLGADNSYLVVPDLSKKPL